MAYANRAINARYTVADGSGATLAARTVNQQLTPDDLAADGAAWEDLGTVSLTASGTLTVSLAASGNAYLIADAVRFERVPAAPAAPAPAPAVGTVSGTAGEPVGAGFLAPESPERPVNRRPFHTNAPRGNPRLHVRPPRVGVAAGHRAAPQTRSDVLFVSDTRAPAAGSEIGLTLGDD